MKPKSSPRSQQPTTSPHPGPDKFQSTPPICIYLRYISILTSNIHVSHKYLSPSAFPTNIVNALFSPMLVPCATPILYFLISSSSYSVTRTNHKASPYAPSFSLVLLPLSPVKIFSAASCSPHTLQPMFFPQYQKPSLTAIQNRQKNTVLYIFNLYIFRWLMGSEKILNCRAASILQI